jgi:hypothetical protein
MGDRSKLALWAIGRSLPYGRSVALPGQSSGRRFPIVARQANRSAIGHIVTSAAVDQLPHMVRDQPNAIAARAALLACESVARQNGQAPFLMCGAVIVRGIGAASRIAEASARLRRWRKARAQGSELHS